PKRLSVEPSFPCLPAVAQASLARPATGLLPFDENLDGRRAAPDQAVANPPAEAASVCHQVQRLQHAALAAAVGPQEQVESGARRDRTALEAAQPGKLEPGYPHGSKAERPDQAGRSCST